MKDPRWVLGSEPRAVQVEALRRSYGGFSVLSSKDGEPVYTRLHSGKERGWSHYLEMRLGKTPLALNEFELLRADGLVKSVVCVCPSSFREGWVEEAEKSGATVPWAVYSSNKVNEAEKHTRSNSGEFGVAINYEALKTEKCKAFLSSIISRGTMLLIDESIKIKNPTSLQTKEVLRIAKEVGFVRNLSGLPMTQGPQDLYPQFRAVGRLNGTNFYTFRNKFCKMGGFENRKIVGTKNEEELQRLIAASSFVAKRKDWGTPLHPEYYQEKVGLTAKQEKHYKEINQEFLTILENGTEVSVDLAVSKMMKLQQISSGFVYAENKAHYFEAPEKLPKLQKLMDILEEADSKVVVCYHYGASGDLLMEHLGKYSPAVIRSANWMKKQGLDVQSEKARFNRNKSCRVMVLQMSSGKYGHDLSGIQGDRCSVMAFYENTFSLDDRTQIEMRNTSAFQDWTNVYLDLVSSPVEMAAIKALIGKEDIVKAILGSYRSQ